MERISDRRLYLKLLGHNMWTNGALLDVNSLGAGGSKNHLIFANTQDKLSNLMTNSELWDLIESIGEYERANGLQRTETPLKAFNEEYKRLDNDKVKANSRIIQDIIILDLNKNKYCKVFGTEFKEADK